MVNNRLLRPRHLPIRHRSASRPRSRRGLRFEPRAGGRPCAALALLQAVILVGSISAAKVEAQSTPWGMRMFGMEFGQSTGAAGPHAADGPWGMEMFGMRFGQAREPGPWGGNAMGMQFGQGYELPPLPPPGEPIRPRSDWHRKHPGERPMR
jgi:hypothetical protein